MSYFSYFPKVYIGEGIKDDESFKYRLMRNIGRRVKLRDEMVDKVTAFEQYTIGTQETPWMLANTLYGNGHLDWCILLANNITDFYSQWPKEERDLMEYAAEIYDDPDAIHHYETQEILYNDIIFIKKGLEVNSTFRVTMPDGTLKGLEDSIYPVTNYEHEVFLNEKKRNIKIPQPFIVSLMEEEMRNLMAYEAHVELDSFNNKQTPLDISARFLDITGYVTGSVTQTDNVGVVTSYDNGPGSTTVKIS